MTEREEWWVTAPSFIGEPPPGRFPTETEDHEPRSEGWCKASCRISLDSLVEQAPDSQDVGSGVAQEEREHR